MTKCGLRWCNNQRRWSLRGMDRQGRVVDVELKESCGIHVHHVMMLMTVSPGKNVAYIEARRIDDVA